MNSTLLMLSGPGRVINNVSAYWQIWDEKQLCSKDGRLKEAQEAPKIEESSFFAPDKKASSEGTTAFRSSFFLCPRVLQFRIGKNARQCLRLFWFL